MMRPDINYYALLGVTSTANDKEIVAAYRKKILEVHLDKMAPGQDSDLCYKTIEAYRVLSNRKLRSKYDIQRDPSHKAGEEFIPAGYICYDVGQSQASKRVLKNIFDWKEEFDVLSAADGGLSDNYFECFSGLFQTVLEVEEKSNAKALKDKEEEFCCSVCDKEYSSETLHWDEVLQPYIVMFAGDSSPNPKDQLNNGANGGGVGPLLMYFEKLCGSSSFHWEPRSLPSTILGLWASEEWCKLDNCDTIIERILDLLPSEEEFEDTEDFIDYIGETFLSDSESDSVLFPEQACKILIFILENQDEQRIVVDRVQECLMRDDCLEIMYLVSAMKNYLGCDHDEWVSLAREAVEAEQAEMAMLWTKVCIEFNEDEDNEYFNGIWYKLGIQLYKIDPVLAHFCFLYQGYGDEEETAYEDWTDLGDDFCLLGEHHAAIEYYLYANMNAKRRPRGNNNNNDSEDEDEEEVDELEKLLEKGKYQLKKGDRTGSALYKSIYHSLKSKSLLGKLTQRKRDDAVSEYDSQLEQLIELVNELDTTNPIEGYRIITRTWPKAFESPVCAGIHKGTINFLRRGRLSPTSFNLILGALHFLPDEEEEDEEVFEELQVELAAECNRMVVKQMRHCMKTSDFDAMGDVLQFMSKGAESRCLPGALELLAELETEAQVQLIEKSPHLKAMKCLMQGTISKIQKNWMIAMNQYQNALLSSPECMHRVLPCISKLSQDLEFHEAILAQVTSEVKGLKECFEAEEYPEVETFDSKRSNRNRNSLVIADVMPQVDFGYKHSISKIQVDPDKVAAQPLPQEEENRDEPPPIETNTPLVTLDKNEEAIGTGKNQGQLNAALSYIDLLKALPLPFQPGPIVMAASHFLRAMDETKDPGSLFAYRNAIMQMAENLLKIDRKTQASIQHGLTHKHMLSVLLAAHEKLSKAMRGRETVPSNDDANKDANEDADNSGGSESGCESESQSESEYESCSSDDDEEEEVEENESKDKCGGSGSSVSESSTGESGENNENEDKGRKKSKNNKQITKSNSEDDSESDKTDASCSENTTSSSEKITNNNTEKRKKPKHRKPKKTTKGISASFTFPNPNPSAKKQGMDLIKTSDAHLISRFLKNVVNFPKIEPLANIPTLNCSDLVYVETLGNSFLSQFCNEKVGMKRQSAKIPKHLHAYTMFVEVWKGRSQLTNFFSARLRAMEELLVLRGWALEDVEQLLSYRLLNLTDDGWSSEYRTELKFPNPPKSFRSICGFKIDNKTGKIFFLLVKDTHTRSTYGNLFDTRDIQEIFSNGIEPTDCVLSLDSPDPNLRSHPFKEAKFSTTNPECCSYTAPSFFSTLSRAAMLICYLCSGLEICSKSPFAMKPTDEGLLLRLEEHLQHILRPAKERRDEDEGSLPKTDLDIPNRFWLKLTEIFEEEEEELAGASSTFTYKIGEVKAQVKMNTLILTLNGARSMLSPEAQFARDFTKHFDEIGKYYPELLRLKELAKICLICKKLRQILRDNEALVKQNGRCKEELGRILGVCRSIRDLGIYLEEDEEKSRVIPGNFTACNWLPASFCNNVDSEIYEVSAGVKINPDITYFPVTIPKDCVEVNAKELMAKKRLSFIRR